MKTKRCTGCKEEKELSAFSKSKATKDMLNYRCRECDNACAKAHYEANKDKKKAYREANKDKIKAKMKAYREANKDKIKAYNEANKDKYKAQMKAYYEATAQSPTKNKHHAKVIQSVPDNTDDLKFNKKGQITVKCTHGECRKRFTPTHNQVHARETKIRAMRKKGLNLRLAGAHLYCSDKCKASCEKFGLRINTIPTDEQASKIARSCQASTKKALVDYQLDTYGYTYCEKCGTQGDVELHHTIEVAKYGKHSISADGHILICNDCHKEATKECRTETIKDIIVPKLKAA